DDLEPRRDRATCGSFEEVDDALDPVRVERDRRWIAGAKRDRARRDDVPSAFVDRETDAPSIPRRPAARLPSRVRELDPRHRAMPLDEGGDAREGGDMVVLPDAEIAGRDSSDRLDRGRLDEHQRGAADRAAAEV